MVFLCIKATLDNLQKHKVPSKCHFYSLKQEVSKNKYLIRIADKTYKVKI